MSKPLIILDRDGVINFDSKNYIKTVDEWIPIPDSIEAIARLKRAGFHVAVATNQSGIGRGFYTVETLEAMHEKLNALLLAFDVALDAIAYCPHHPDAGCDCRKPKPGLLDTIAKQLNADLSRAIIVGDSLRDLQVGLSVGAKAVLVLTGNGEKTQAAGLPESVEVYRDLSHWVDIFLEKYNA